MASASETAANSSGDSGDPIELMADLVHRPVSVGGSAEH